MSILEIPNFQKGLISRISDDDIPDNAFSDCRNIDLSEKYLPMAIKGHQKYNTSPLADKPIKGAIIYKHKELGEIIVCVSGGFLWNSKVGSSQFNKYQINGNDVFIDETSSVEMVQYNNNLYIVNGKYPVIENSGNDTAKILKISKDTVSVLTDDNIPKGLKYIIIHNERMFGASTIDEPNGLYWSEPYEPENWTPVYGLNYDLVGKDDGEDITGIVTLNENYVYVFKTHNVYRYLTTGDITQWSSNKVDTEYGAIAHRTIKLFEGSLIYLSPNGVARLNGNTSVLIDDSIRDKTTKVQQSEGVEVQRSYTKNSNFDFGYNLNGIITVDNNIKVVKDIEVGKAVATSIQRFPLKPNEYNGKYIAVNEESVECVGVPRKYDIQTSPYSAVQMTFMQKFNSAETFRHYYIFPIYQEKDITLSSISLFVTAKTQTNIKNHYFQLQILEGYNYTNPIYTSNINYGSITVNAWNTWQFSNQILQGGKTYWFRIIGFGSIDSSIIGRYDMTLSARVFDKVQGGYYSHYINGISSVNVSPWLQYTNINEQEYIYISDEYDTFATNKFNLQSAIKKTLSGKSYSTYKIKLSVANYNDVNTPWESILAGDIQTFELTQASIDTMTLNKEGKRYLKFKIEFLENLYGIEQMKFINSDNYSYESEPMRISNDNPASWGIFEVGTNSGLALPTYWLRSGDNETEILEAIYYRVEPEQQIIDVPLKRFVQFKIDFAPNSNNAVNFLRVHYTTSETFVKPCSATWKTKYILNMNDGEGADNNIEYIFDKDGYWVIKDNEYNSIYFRSIDRFFAGSIIDGTIRYKDTGYLNDDTPYECSFTTKKFRLTNLENLFRFIKAQYKSEIPIQLSYSIDEASFINVELEPYGRLYEIRETLAGIVRGQTIQFKISFVANSKTEIHNLALLWEALRELNRR